MSEDNKLIIFTDGGSRGNPGPGACAFVIRSADKILSQQSFLLGHTTNNQAEYSAVINALKFLVDNPLPILSTVPRIVFKSDSQLLVSQLSGLFKIKDFKLRQLVLKVKQLENVINDKYANISIIYIHIPRSDNYLADRLLNEKLDSNF